MIKSGTPRIEVTMIQIHIENENNQNIYRKLQLTKDQTLLDLEMILEAVFDLHEIDTHIQLVRTNGKPLKRILHVMDEDGLYEDSSDDLLHEWLVQPGDELLVIDEEFEFRVVLERILSEEGSNICIDGEGHLYSKNKKKVNLDDINMELNSLAMLESLIFDNFENMLEPDYGELLALSNELNKLKPWTYFSNEDIIAVELAESEEMFYVAVMGAAGQEYGLMIYREEFGYPILVNILEGKPLPLDYHFDLNGMTVNFVDRADLELEDYELIKEHGFTFRGKNKWIQFRNYYPGSYPTVPGYADVENFKRIVQTMIHATKLAKKGAPFPHPSLHQYPTFKVSEEGDVSEMYIIEVEQKPKGQIEIDINDLERAQFKRKQKVALQLEFDMFYMTQLVPSLENDERLVYPTLCVALDRATGENVFFELLPFPKITPIQQQMFWEVLKSMPVRPSKIFVRKETYEILAKLAKKLGIELVISELPIINDFRDYMESMPPDFDEFN